MVKTPIRNLTADDRAEIRAAIDLAVELWPNAHLGDYTPRQDMRAAFKLLRDAAHHYASIGTAAHVVSENARRHASM